VNPKNMYGVKTKQEMNDCSPALFDGNRHLFPAKTRQQVPKPAMQDLWLLFQSAAFNGIGVSRLQAYGMMVVSPIKPDPSRVRVISHMSSIGPPQSL
jgi:hypothetical protein